VNITTDFDRGFQLEQNRLLNENLSSLIAKLCNLLLGELHGLAGLGSTHLKELVDDSVDV